MEDKKIKLLQSKIELALQKAAQQLLETKKRNKQPLIVSRDGKIEVVKPWLNP